MLVCCQQGGAKVGRGSNGAFQGTWSVLGEEGANLTAVTHAESYIHNLFPEHLLVTLGLTPAP